jgi:hypothetical protein
LSRHGECNAIRSTMMRTFCVLTVLVAGCKADDLLDDVPDAGVEDADAALPPGDFGCLDEPWPTEAPDPIRLTGHVADGQGGPVIGATVEILDAGDLSVLATTTSLGSPDPGARGNYAVDLATGGTAPLIVRRVRQLGRIDSYLTGPAPVR